MLFQLFAFQTLVIGFVLFCRFDCSKVVFDMVAVLESTPIEKLENELSRWRKGTMPGFKDIFGCYLFDYCFSLARTDNLTTALHGRCDLGKC